MSKAITDLKISVAILTPTTRRPVGLDRCRYYVERCRKYVEENTDWTLTGFEHVVAEGDDGPEQPAQNLSRNLMNALSGAAPYEFHVVFEDDDWYREDYLARMLELRLSPSCGFYGFGDSTYYFLPDRSRRHLWNTEHASLCNTAWDRDSAEKIVKRCCNYAYNRKSAFIDKMLWQEARGKGVLEMTDVPSIGMKGLPGQAGIGIGHRPRGAEWRADADGAWLRERMGNEDAEWYLNLNVK
jgi:hypothetical protein